MVAVWVNGCQKTNDHLDRARDLAFHQDFKAALSEYETAMVELGRDETTAAKEMRAAALRSAADLCYLHLTDYVKAAQLYRDLSERYPDRPETFEARANLADILRDHFDDKRGALAQLGALVQSFPNHLGTDEYQYQAAQDYFALRDYAQAETEIKQFLVKYKGSPLRGDAELLLASAVAYQGRRPEALELYAKITQNRPGPDAGRAHLEVARLHEDVGDLEKAEGELQLALKDYPEPKVVTVALSRVKRRIALRKPVDIKDHGAIFDSGAEQAAGLPRGGE